MENILSRVSALCDISLRHIFDIRKDTNKARGKQFQTSEIDAHTESCQFDFMVSSDR